MAAATLISLSASANAAPVTTQGSEISAHPHVYVIFWGSNFERQHEYLAAIERLYGELSNSPWAGTLTQYWGPEGVGPAGETTYAFVSKEIPYSAWWDKSVHGGSISSPAQIEAEIGNAIRANALAGWPQIPTPNDQFVVVPAPGTSFSSEFVTGYPACGWHEHGFQSGIGNFSYAFVAYGSREANPQYAGCDGPYVAAHELAEAATEPMFAAATLNGWNTQSGPGGEIADICEEYGPAYTAGGIRIPKLWDNSTNSCSTGNPSPPQNSPRLVTTAPTEVSETTAMLHAAPVLNGLKVENFWFEWGETASYGHQAGYGYGFNLGLGAKANISELQPGHTYHFRFVVTAGKFGVTKTLTGPDAQFITP